jgi:hypothetical protein
MKVTIKLLKTNILKDIFRTNIMKWHNNKKNSKIWLNIHIKCSLNPTLLIAVHKNIYI